MRSADVVLVLDDGVAILCHSQILSLHSAVIRGMLAELPAGQHDDPINIPRLQSTSAQHPWWRALRTPTTCRTRCNRFRPT